MYNWFIEPTGQQGSRSPTFPAVCLIVKKKITKYSYYHCSLVEIMGGVGEWRDSSSYQRSQTGNIKTSGSTV